ncbi:polysaccharide lyase 6 family protein [Haloferula sp.]|uniref:polysaccharide lyase 6 family protein n=1 Tax=Haloferula sp. TaxID=2497595 RepID=UPI00329D25E4
MKSAHLKNLLILVAIQATTAWGDDIVQGSSDDHIAFQAQSVDSILNPDAADDVQGSSATGSPESPERVWTLVSDANSLSGEVLMAPPSPHKQTSNTSLQESIAVYSLRFATAGTYHVYFRARNDGTPESGSSDSFWAPTDWNEANPSDATSTGKTGSYEWREPLSIDVSAGELDTPLEFRIGVRESDAHLDAVVLSQQTGLDDATLDALVPTTPPPPDSGIDCVENLSELNAAIAAAQPGDTIYMCDGVWTDTVIDFDTDGLPGQPITLRAEVDGQVRLEGESKLMIAGDDLVVQGLCFINGGLSGGHVIEFRGGSSDLANRSRLTECAIIDYNPADPTTNYKWVSVYGLNNRVDHCHFSGMNHIGVTLTVWLGDGAAANHTQIDNNYFGDRTQGDGNGFETIRIGTSARSSQDSEAVVEDNLFYRCDGEIEIISNKSVGNIYRRNTFLENSGQLTLRHGSDCLVEQNFFLGNGVSGSSGVRIIGPDHVVQNNYFADLEGSGTRAAIAIMNGVPDSPLNRYLRAERDVIAFNTFVNCAESLAIGTESSVGDTTLAPKDCVYANNVVSSSDGPLINEINTPENMLYEGNIMFGADTGVSPNPGITVTDPLLSLADDGLMRPATNSPVIDSAAGSYPDVLADMDGQSRTLASQDIGADEVSSEPVTIRPLDADEVGPRWLRPSTLRITGVSVSANSADITFEDLTGLAPAYTLERSDDNMLGGWTPVAELVPAAYTTTEFTITDSTANSTATGFWRVSTD